MANQIRIGHIKNTNETWENLNPILLDGELVLVETVEGDIRAKIGNGKDSYNNLPFFDERFPKINPEDEGKFLIVENGKWVAKTIPFSTIYTGFVTPPDTVGEDGDLYLQTE